MAWAKALVELACELDLSNPITTINFNLIANKYLKYYWNQTIFFDLIQGSNPSKPPLLLSCVKGFIKDYQIAINSTYPELFERAESNFSKLNLDIKFHKLITKIVNILKKDVSWRFLRLGKENTTIYQYTQNDNYLYIDSSLLKEFKDNEQDLYDLINYRWGLILESFNSSPRINKKVKIMDERGIKRNSLEPFKKYLDLENSEHVCFICGNKIDNDEVSIDHVIPWTYMYSDDVWNLVYVCKSCNSSKSNKVPTKNEIDRLKARNERLKLAMEHNEIHTKIYDELKLSIEKDYVQKFYIGSKS